jgi:Ca2+-binding EF-hand superfamily protein
MWNLFKYFDLNNKGYITSDDMQEILAREGIKMTE